MTSLAALAAVRPRELFQRCDEFPREQLLERVLYAIAQGYIILNLLPSLAPEAPELAGMIYIGEE